MDNIEIRTVKTDELEKLQKIGRQTFSETFSSGNNEEDMIRYLDDGFSSEKLKSELNDKESEFYFALFDKKVIGYLKINFGQSQTDLKTTKPLK